MLLSPSPGLVQASFLSGPSDGKLPLVYTPLDLSVAKGQLFAGAWTKLRHMDRGAHAWARVEGGEGELNAGAEYLLSITPRHHVEIKKFLLDFKAVIKTYVPCRSIEHMSFDSG